VSDAAANHDPRESDVRDFLDHLAKERDVSPNTVRAYERDLTEFVRFLGRYYSGGTGGGAGD
jgi:site-specific recombinase XerD